MQVGLHVDGPLRAPAVLRLLRRDRRRRSRCGCLLDPAGSCALASLPRAVLDEFAAELEAHGRSHADAGPTEPEALVALRRWSANVVRRRRLRRARAGVGVTVVSTAYALAMCVVAGASMRLTAGVVITLAAAGTSLALLVFVPQSDTGWPLVQLTSGLLCAACFGVFLIVEGALHRVLVGDELATLLGLGAAGVSLLLQAAVTRFQNRKQ
jgi:hypothetical protein